MIKTVNSKKIAYIHELSLGICKILFRKKSNGRFRAVYGTLNKLIIPGNHQKTLINTLKSRENSEIVPIYDVKSGKWKSFYIKNVISFTETDKLKTNKKY